MKGGWPCSRACRAGCVVLAGQGLRYGRARVAYSDGAAERRCKASASRPSPRRRDAERVAVWALGAGRGGCGTGGARREEGNLWHWKQSPVQCD